jgi:hypothetical protein
MEPDRHLHESDLRARLMNAFPTDGAIEFLNRMNRTAGRRDDAAADATTHGKATQSIFGPTDLPEHFPWPRADGSGTSA